MKKDYNNYIILVICNKYNIFRIKQKTATIGCSFFLFKSYRFPNNLGLLGLESPIYQRRCHIDLGIHPRF